MNNQILLNFEKIYYPEIRLSYNPKYKNNYDMFTDVREIECKISIAGNVNIINDNKLICIVNCNVMCNHKDFADFSRLNIISHGIFATPDKFSIETVQEYHQNFYAIVYPFIRETAHSVFMKNRISFIMPIINFLQTIKDNPSNFKIMQTNNNGDDKA
ncbi:MAG: hypothetical protein KBA61_00130 [Spirochaetes bacterium]|nr:hypothetical protein [Spirochaetota bacterium]